MKNIPNFYTQINSLPREHEIYLSSIKNIQPKVIYDIGSNVLHWYKIAKKIWPTAHFYCFDALPEVEFLYDNIDFTNCVLSNENDRLVDFYYSLMYPGGSSYYQENSEINKKAAIYFSEDNKRQVKTITLDTVVSTNNFLLPDLIKMDTQGSELDIIKGAKISVEHAKDIILELQNVDYNKGAPKAPEVIDYMNSIDYVCVAKKFTQNIYDADYHFKNKRYL